MITLGFEPYPIQVNLAHDSDFVAMIRADEPWPDGVSIELHFPATALDTAETWPAEVDGRDALWDVPAAEVAPVVVANRSRQVRLVYSVAGESYLWGRGRVHVD